MGNSVPPCPKVVFSKNSTESLHEKTYRAGGMEPCKYDCKESVGAGTGSEASLFEGKHQGWRGRSTGDIADLLVRKI